MKSKELMIGDWAIMTKDKGLVRIGELSGLCAWVNVEPVPITPEILTRNKFHDWGAKDFELLFDKDNMILRVAEYPATRGIWSVTIRDGYNLIKLHIKFVHELQHALRLCGIDKEIEL